MFHTYITVYLKTELLHNRVLAGVSNVDYHRNSDDPFIRVCDRYVPFVMYLFDHTLKLDLSAKSNGEKEVRLVLLHTTKSHLSIFAGDNVKKCVGEGGILV